MKFGLPKLKKKKKKILKPDSLRFQEKPQTKFIHVISKTNAYRQKS